MHIQKPKNRPIQNSKIFLYNIGLVNSLDILTIMETLFMVY